MRKQYLHLSAYICDECKGPVVSGLLAVREDEISRETDIRPIGAICLSCGHRQPTMTEPGITHQFPPISWESAKLIEVQTLQAGRALCRPNEALRRLTQWRRHFLLPWALKPGAVLAVRDRLEVKTRFGAA